MANKDGEMRHGHTLARERFLKDLNDVLREILKPINEKRKREGDKPYTVESWIGATFEKGTVAHYVRLVSGVNNETTLQKLDTSWLAVRGPVLAWLARVKGDTKLKSLDDRYGDFRAHHKWAIARLRNQKRVTFDLLRDGVPIEKLRDEDEFQSWIDKWVEMSGEHGRLRRQREGTMQWEQCNRI